MPPSVKDVLAILDDLPSDISETERWQLTDALRSKLHLLQTPFERSWEMTLASPLVYSAIKTLLNLGLWETWRTAEGEEKSVDELVELCGGKCEANLLRRFLRLLAAREVVEETGRENFRTNKFSKALGEHGVAQTMLCATHHWLPMALYLPEKLAEEGYQEPKDPKKAAYVDMPYNPEKLSVFTRLRWQLHYQESALTFMAEITKWKQNWLDYFDATHLVDDNVMREIGSTPLFVDVGGNNGADVSRFLERFPNACDGSIVLQDVPDVIATAEVDAKIMTLSHDFFTPQPIRGSRIYFLHSVLHDWPDEQAKDILRNLIPAFRRGYSTLLVTDVVVPPEKASVMQAAHDVCLMGELAASERTKAHWTVLLKSAGFRVVRIWNDGRGIESVIEAVLDGDEVMKETGDTSEE